MSAESVNIEALVAEVAEEFGFVPKVVSDKGVVAPITEDRLFLVRPAVVVGVDGETRARVKYAIEGVVMAILPMLDSDSLVAKRGELRSELLEMVAELRRCDGVVDVSGVEIKEPRNRVAQDFGVQLQINATVVVNVRF